AALEIRHVFSVAEEVFSGRHSARLRRFVGGWFDQPRFLHDVLVALGPDVQVDAVGPAFYFAPRDADVATWLSGWVEGGPCPNCPTPGSVLDSARHGIPDLRAKLRAHRLIADARVNPD